MNTNINIISMKQLVPVCTGNVRHFCKYAARLYGKLALREQLNYETATHSFSSIEMVIADREELKAEIINLARECATTMRRLNINAKKAGICPPLVAIDNMELSDFIEAIDNYVTALVEESDYKMWQEEFHI